MRGRQRVPEQRVRRQPLRVDIVRRQASGRRLRAYTRADDARADARADDACADARADTRADARADDARAGRPGQRRRQDPLRRPLPHSPLHHIGSKSYATGGGRESGERLDQRRADSRAVLPAAGLVARAALGGCAS